MNLVKSFNIFWIMLAMYFYGNQGENSELVCGLVQPIQKVAEKKEDECIGAL